MQLLEQLIAASEVRVTTRRVEDRWRPTRKPWTAGSGGAARKGRGLSGHHRAGLHTVPQPLGRLGLVEATKIDVDPGPPQPGSSAWSMRTSSRLERPGSSWVNAAVISSLPYTDPR
jgi:hypothetical protein